jgi:hypothetical protein
MKAATFLLSLLTPIFSFVSVKQGQQQRSELAVAINYTACRCANKQHPKKSKIIVKPPNGQMNKWLIIFLYYSNTGDMTG